MLVQVTQEIIDSSIRLNCDKCAVAEAINAVLSDKFKVVVGVSAHIYKSENVEFRHTECIAPLTSIYLGGRVNGFIRRFDSGEAVKPISFEIDIPAVYLKGQ